MANENSNPPSEGTPEFKKWLKEKSAKDIEDIFEEDYRPAAFEEGGSILGNKENLSKSDAGAVSRLKSMRRARVINNGFLRHVVYWCDQKNKNSAMGHLTP